MGRYISSSAGSVLTQLLRFRSMEDRIRHIPSSPSILVVPTQRQVEVVLRAWVSVYGGGEPPIVETMAGLYRRLGKHVLSDQATILQESSVDVLLKVILQHYPILRSVGMEAQKLVRWTQYGMHPSHVHVLSEAAGSETRRGIILAQVAEAWNTLIDRYAVGLCDRGTYARALMQKLNYLIDKPLTTASNDVITTCVMLDTHGITLLDRDLLMGLSRIGWDVGIAFAEEYPMPADLALGYSSPTSDAVTWFVANGWEHSETPAVESEYESVTVAFATREEEVRRVVAAIKEDVKNGISLRDVAICVPGATAYRQIIVDVARRSGLPLEVTSIRPLVSTHAATAAKSVCDLVLRNWLRVDVERLAFHGRLRLRYRGLSDLIAVIQSERFLGGTSLDQWRITLDEAHEKAREVLDALEDRTSSDSKRAERWLRKITSAAETLNTIAEHILLRADVMMDAATFTERLTSTLQNLGFDRDEYEYQELAEVLVQYMSVSERFSLPRVTLQQHVSLWWSMMEGASPLIEHEVGRGVEVLSPAELRCKDWKRLYVLGMVEGEFPRMQEHMLDREIIPGLLEGMYVQSMMDILHAVSSGGRLVCTRPRAIDEAPTIPSSLLEMVGGVTIPIPAPLDSTQSIALYPYELQQREEPQYQQPQLVQVRQIESMDIDVELIDNIVAELNYPVSPSRLDVMVTCPYLLFAERLLGIDVQSRSDENLTPLERGNMLHDVAAAFFQHLQPKPTNDLNATERLLNMAVRLDPNRFEEYWELLHDLAQTRMRMEEWKHTLSGIERQALLGSVERPGLLRQWLALEIAYQTVSGHAPVFFEQTIANDVQVFQNGQPSALSISVRLDRVDIAQCDDGITFIVNDYKTTVHNKYSLKQIIAGDLTQMPMYIEAVRTWFADQNIAARPMAAVYRSFGRDLHNLNEPQNLVVMRDPSFEINKQDRGLKLPSWSGDVASFAAEPLVDQNQILMEQIAGIAADIRGGEFAVRPKDGACVHCNYKELCRVEQWGTR